MKCIGVNQWAGVDPATARILCDLEGEATRMRLTKERCRRRMAPSERFLSLAEERFVKPRRFGVAPVPGLWGIGDWAVAEFNEISFCDLRDAGRFLIHLQGFYIVDGARGQGEGKRAIEQIKQLADESGCGVTLFARPFAYSRDGVMPNAVETFEELVRVTIDKDWAVVYLPQWEAEVLRGFYEGCGFQNMCLYDSRVLERPKEADMPFESQFVYLPNSLEPAWRRSLQTRLNRELCEFCNR